MASELFDLNCSTSACKAESTGDGGGPPDERQPYAPIASSPLIASFDTGRYIANIDTHNVVINAHKGIGDDPSRETVS